MLKSEGAIDVWHDRKILAGDSFDGAIDEQVEFADVILLLASADFLASRYCYDVEVRRAMQLHQAGCLLHSPGYTRELARPGKQIQFARDRVQTPQIRRAPDREASFVFSRTSAR